MKNKKMDKKYTKRIEEYEKMMKDMDDAAMKNLQDGMSQARKTLFTEEAEKLR